MKNRVVRVNSKIRDTFTRIKNISPNKEKPYTNLKKKSKMNFLLIICFIFQRIWEDMTLLLVVISAILLLLTEILSPKYGKINIKIDRTKLRTTAFVTGILASLSLIILILIPSSS